MTTTTPLCAGCGRANRTEAVFCTGCGTPLATAPQPPVQSSWLTEGPAPHAGYAPSTVASTRPWTPLPGPVDRISFFKEQRRRRRQSRWVSAMCALVATITGIPLSLVLTPVLAMALLLLLKLVTLVTGESAFVRAAIAHAFTALGDAFSRLDDPGGTGEPGVRVIVTAALLWLLPGMLTMLGLWLVLRSLFRQAGVGAVALSVGARPPRAGDLEERQLVNVVEEMAIAAGLPAPRVLLIDADLANAAVAGSGPDDATLIVSRRLLDEVDRDQTQGILATLVGAVGNGDLRVALSIIAVYQTFGAMAALLKAPFSREARRAVWGVLRFALQRGRPDAAVQAEVLTRLLTRELADIDATAIDMEARPDGVVPPDPGGLWPALRYLILPTAFVMFVIFMTDRMLFWEIALPLLVLGGVWVWHYRAWVRYAIYRGYVMSRAMLVLPYYLAVAFPQLLIMIVGPFLLGPLIAWLWRTRRYLADATAVQLTRNPDGLAQGLTALAASGGGLAGGAWAAPFFVVQPGIAPARRGAQAPPAMQDVKARLAHARAQPGLDSSGRLQAQIAAMQEVAAAHASAEVSGAGDNALSGGFGSIGGFHPAVAKRLKRLRALGSTVGGDTPRRFHGMFRGAQGLITVGLLLLFSVLITVAAVLMALVAVIFLALSLGAAALLMLLMLVLARALFG